jgi:hypothetical protein
MANLTPAVALAASPACAMPFLSSVLVSCLEIRSVWFVDLSPDASRPDADWHQLLAFADATTLSHLRKLEDLHRTDVEFLVVTDGDAFESAWGPRKLSGSLARWGWRQVSPVEAYYDCSCWTERSGAGQIVRVRRKALLAWPSPEFGAR